MCIIAFSWLITQVIVGAFLSHLTLAELGVYLVQAAGVAALRALLSWLAEVLSNTAAIQIKRQLREQLLEKIDLLGPAWAQQQSSARLTVVAGRGLDALDSYFSQYVPQLVLTALATPILLIVLFVADALTAIVVAITLPLIPVFMILIGWFTQSVQRTQWDALARLSAHFLDVVEGLSTLKIFGRQHHQTQVIRSVTEEYRKRTMKVLRVSFASGFVLELAASLSVALVAVSIGTRLISGEVGLLVGLFVLLITPECYLPIRNVGASYHAATEGIEAAEDVFTILDQPVNSAAGQEIPLSVATPSTLEIDGLSVSYGGTAPVVSVDRVTAAAGEITVLRGRSGAGKSTVFRALLGFIEVDAGVLTISASAGVQERLELAEGYHLRQAVSWSGQTPALQQGTVLANLTVGAVEPDRDVAVTALKLASLSHFDLDRVLDVHGGGISGGQAQRLALARAYYRLLSRQQTVLLLDEPTSALDPETEHVVIAGWRELADRGTVVIVISHRPSVFDVADRLVEILPAPVDTTGEHAALGLGVEGELRG